jgi:hypothetical protein
MRNTTMTTSPAAQHITPLGWQRALFGFLGCFTAVLSQAGRLVWSLVLWFRQRAAGRALGRRQRALGQAMLNIGVGDQLILERVTTLQSQLHDPKFPADKRQATRNALQDGLEELGSTGLHTTVPVLAVEREHTEMVRAQDALVCLQRQGQENRRRLWPATLFGWLQLLCSYAVLACLALFLLTVVAPNQMPSALVTLFGRQPTTSVGSSELPSGRSGDLEVRISSARVGYAMPVKGPIGTQVATDSAMFRIELGLTNRSTNQTVAYKTWRGQHKSVERDFATLIDNEGNAYMRITFGRTIPEGGVEETTIGPGQTIQDLLFFNPLREDIEHVDLFLPASNFGGQQPIKLRLNNEAIERPNRKS